MTQINKFENAEFWDKTAEKYADSPIQNMENYLATLADTKRYLTPKTRMLEIGAGTGSTAIKLAPFVDEILCTDISSEMMRIATAKAKNADIKNIEFRQVALSEFGQWDEKFDVVIGFNLLHLISDLPSMLITIQRLVKPGGVFISKSALLSGRWRMILPMIAAMRMIGRAPYANGFSQKTLDSYLDQAGFECIETRLYPTQPPNYFVVAKRIA